MRAIYFYETATSFFRNGERETAEIVFTRSKETDARSQFQAALRIIFMNSLKQAPVGFERSKVLRRIVRRCDTHYFRLLPILWRIPVLASGCEKMRVMRL